jgi:hypothetical protein
VKTPAGRGSARVESPGEARLWSVLLGVGGVFGVVLLGRQVFDYVSDAGRGELQRNDLFSALGSVAMLIIVGVIAARREQVRRQVADVGSSGRGRSAKRSAARRKGRT